MNTMLETLETRTLMSASPADTVVADAAEPVGMLVVAVQKVREPAGGSTHTNGANFALADGAVHFVSSGSTGVNVLMGDSSVRNVSGGVNVAMADGSVRFISDSISVSTW